MLMIPLPSLSTNHHQPNCPAIARGTAVPHARHINKSQERGIRPTTPLHRDGSTVSTYAALDGYRCALAGLTGGYEAPGGFEGECFNLVTHGEIPASINGTFYRVGPDPQVVPKFSNVWSSVTGTNGRR
jgi:hypothetical protein